MRLQLVTALAQQANSEAALLRWTAAVESYVQAVTLLDGLIAADPGNQRIRTLLSYLLLRRAPALIRSGLSTEAARSTRRGLVLLEAQATRAAAGPIDANEYALWLLTCVPETERRPSEALRFAKRAVEAQPNPIYLDTLALAYFHTGSRQEAVTAAERALAMLPPLPPGVKSTGLRSEIEGHLAQFRGRQ